MQERSGEIVGGALLNYLEQETAEGREVGKERFAEAVVNALESGSHQEKVQAIKAILLEKDLTIAFSKGY